MDTPTQAEDDEVRTVLFPDISLFEDSDSEKSAAPVELSDWAKSKIGTFQARLETELQNREKKGYRYHGLSQVSSAILINLVNESFGFNGWSSSVLECETLSEVEDTQKKVFSAKKRALVRISLRDGTCIEADGYGESMNQPHKYQSSSNSSKMAITNGLRNAILQFADLLKVETSIKVET